MKIKLTYLLLILGFVSNAQPFFSKRGQLIYPQKGNFSIGVGASSTIGFLGNLINKDTTNSSFKFDWVNSKESLISGKWMKDSTTAYRANFRIGIKSESKTFADAQEDSISKIQNSSYSIFILGGIQKYRGSGRLKGIYGAEAGFGLSAADTNYNYNGIAPNTSILEYKVGTSFKLCVRTFVGVEYFFAPKISLGGEFGWGVVVATKKADQLIKSDGNGGVKTTQLTSERSVIFDTDNASAALSFNLYF